MSAMFEFAGVKCEVPLKIAKPKPVACRCCLAAERPLQPLGQSQASLYEQLTGTTIAPSDIYPKFLCSYCRAMLLKFSEFRTKCLSSQETFLNLHHAGIPITKDLLNSGVAGLPYPPLVPSFAQLITISSHEQLPDGYGSVNQQTACDNMSSNNLIAPFKRGYETGEMIEDDHTDTTNTNTASIIEDTKKWIKEFKDKRNSTKKMGANLKLNKDSTPIQLTSSLHENYGDIFMGDDDDTSDFMSDTYEAIPFGLTDINRGQDTLDFNKVKLEISHPQQLKLESEHLDQNSCNEAKNTSRPPCLVLEPLATKIKSGKYQKRYIRQNRSWERYQEILKETFLQKHNVTMITLSKEEQIEQFMEKKNAPVYKNAKHKCELCYKGFSLKAKYMKHMDENHPNDGQQDKNCDVCHIRFRQKNRFRHNHSYNYQCNECGFISKSKTVAVSHYNEHRGIKYHCEICGKTCNRLNSLLGHMQIHHASTDECPICSLKFNGPKGLRFHMWLKHKEAVDAVCGTCGVQFHSHDALRRHLPQDGIGSCDHTHRPCAACGEGFPTEELLQQHKQEHHRNEFTCNECGKTFESLRRYDIHRCQQTQGKPKHRALQPCRRENATRTQTSSASHKTFVCEVCGIVKQSKILMSSHMRSHTKPFQCDYCQHRFSMKMNLEKHIYRHLSIPQTSKRQYLCCYCPKTFIHYANRRRHEDVVHLKRREFHCDRCGNTYQDKFALQNHFNTKHLGMPWPKRIRNQRKK